MYYILEALEAEYVHFFLAEVLLSFTPQSVVLRHDGLYIFPPPSQALIDAAAVSACHKYGLPEVTMKVSSLLEARETVIKEIYQSPSTSMYDDESLFCQLNRCDWWDNLHVPPPNLSQWKQNNLCEPHVMKCLLLRIETPYEGT